MSTEASWVGTQARSVLTQLPIPTLDDMSEQQLRGQVCVWGGETLTNETAKNLGPRRKKRLDGHYNIYPRGCRHCVGDAAERMLRDHAGLCEQCTDNASLCGTRQALEELMREGR